MKTGPFSLKQREIPELSDAPDLFTLMLNDMVPLQGCHEEAIYLGCYRVKVGQILASWVIQALSDSVANMGETRTK